MTHHTVDLPASTADALRDLAAAEGTSVSALLAEGAAMVLAARTVHTCPACRMVHAPASAWEAQGWRCPECGAVQGRCPECGAAGQPSGNPG